MPNHNSHLARGSVRLKETIAKYFTLLDVLQVVPPDQARKIYKALKESGLPVALVEYEGEQHGFRKVRYRTNTNCIYL